MPCARPTAASRAAADRGAAILDIDPPARVAERMCDRILAMDKGKLGLRNETNEPGNLSAPGRYERISLAASNSSCLTSQNRQSRSVDNRDQFGHPLRGHHPHLLTSSAGATPRCRLASPAVAMDTVGRLAR
jgi:ABC-type multidrug transport system ATPase subunit